MSDARPKLLIVGGDQVPTEILRGRLADLYEVVIGASTGDADGAAVVLAAREAHESAAVRSAPLESLAALLNATGESVALAEPNGAVVWSNDLYSLLAPSVRERLGVVASEATRSLVALRKMYRPQDGAGVRTWRGELSETDVGPHYDVMVSPVDPRPYGKPAAGEEPWPRGLAVVVRDVTESRRLRQRMDAIDQAGSDLVQIETQAVREKNMIERLALLESRIVKAAHDLLHFDHFAVRILDERTGKLELVIKHNLPAEYDAFDLYPRAEGNGISGWVAATGRSYICKDALSDELFLPGLHGARSSLTVPLKFHDRVIGIMNVESQQASAFDEDDRRLAEIFARYIAMAVHTLDLLVVERTMTNRAIAGRFEQELDEPLKDIMNEVDVLRAVARGDGELLIHIDKIRGDVEAIRRRMRDAAEGPTTLLGVERALEQREVDPALAGRRVLVADDQSKIRRIIGDVLRNRGCDVTVCENGGEAIREIERVTRGEIAPFHLVVSDIMMPEANGYEVFSAVKAAMQGTPVILMTGFGYDPNHSIVRASQEGLQSVLFKPFQVEQLVDLVKKAMPGVAG